MSKHPLDMLRATPHCQVPGRPRVLPDRSEFGRNRYMMTHAALGNTALSPDMAARTAQAWYEQAASMAATAVAVSDMALSLSQAADSLLNVAAGTPVQPEPQMLPSNVFSLGAARAARAARQGVQR